MPRQVFVFFQPAFDNGLRRDPGVIGSRHPERFVALHASRANDDVLQRVVQSVAKMQRAGHVGRRDHDRERLSVRIDFCGRTSGIVPSFGNPGGSGCMIKSIWNFVMSR